MNKKIFKLFRDKIEAEISSLVGIEVKNLYLATDKVEGEFVLTIIFTDLIS